MRSGPTSIRRSTGSRRTRRAPTGRALDVTDMLSRRMLSLPMANDMSGDAIDAIVECVLDPTEATGARRARPDRLMIAARDRFEFAACGDDVTVYEWVRILDPERIEVGIPRDRGRLRVHRRERRRLHRVARAHRELRSQPHGGGKHRARVNTSGISGGSRLVSGTDLVRTAPGSPARPSPTRWRAV